MSKQILADIRFHTDTKGMAKISHDKLQYGPQHIAAQHRDHHREKGLVHFLRQHIIQSASCHQWEQQIDGCNANGT